MLEEIFSQTEERMKKAIETTKMDFNNIRTGRASVKLLDNVKVDYYNSLMPINQLASLSTPDARTITIQPWDKGSIEPIEKAINKSGLGLNPANDGNIIRINIPMLTEERRKDLVKLARKISEDHKVAIRNIRRDINEKIKDKKKNGEVSEDDSIKALDKIQKVTDKYIAEVDAVTHEKEQEILEF